MGRIGATLSGFERQLLNQLAETNAAAAMASLRLATGRKINQPRDNPSGFVLLSTFQAQRAAALRTAEVVSVSQSLGADVQLAIDRIRAQLNTLREKALADEDQALTADERLARQAAIDAAVAEINRIVAGSQGGRRMLDGSADFAYAGVNAAQVRSLRALSLGGAAAVTLSGHVTTAAARAQLGHDAGGASIAADAAFQLGGDRGAVSIQVTAGESLSDVAARIDQESHRTGVTAVAQGTTLVFTSIAYGSAAEVEISVTSGVFAVGSGGHAVGVDAAGTFNGRSFTAQGNRFSLNLEGAVLQFELADDFSGALAEMTVSGTAPSFVVSPDLARRATLALPSLAAWNLGGWSGTIDQLATGGAWGELGANAPRAVRIVDEALGQLTRIEGQVDGFVRQTLQSSRSLWSGLAAETQTAIDAIDKSDEQEDALLLAKNQMLAANIVASLEILADQRAGIVEILRKAAGLR